MNIAIEIINQFYLKLSRSAKKGVFLCTDFVAFILSIFLAFVLRFDLFDALIRIPTYQIQILLLIPVKLSFFWIVGVYRPVLRYTGLEFLGTAVIASTGGTGVFALASILLVLHPLPRSILVMDAFITLIFIVAIRLGIRWIVYKAIVQNQRDTKSERVVIYGAGEAAFQLVQALSGENRYKVVAFVDDSSQLRNQSMHGIKVYPTNQLKKLIKKHEANSILLALDSTGIQERKGIIENIQSLGVGIKTMPSVSEIISGKVSISEIRDIDIVDLLGREEIDPDPVLMQKNIKGKTVLVTGAGGSIGSELCRQIIQLEPKELILFELNEFALYKIDIELKENYPNVAVFAYLGTTLNQLLLEKTLSDHKTETVYHAAAYKHVPLIEANISEGIYNNIKGTLSCVKASINCAVRTFVLISTDKAVRPTNVMGTTKRISELILQAFSQKSEIKTNFIMVRFGNVLDSAGSVVPRFRKQLTEGKNLTITHKDIKRYFMSIPEASRLVIQAGALGKGGEVFLLEMGEPVRIYDLAIQMIELSGLSLGEDIDIEVTGIRPGEKLFEELLIDHDKSESTSHPKIFCAKEDFISWEELESRLMRLFMVAESSNKEEILKEMKKLVPEFSHNQHIN